MKTKLLSIGLLLTFTFIQSQNYIQTTTTPFSSLSTITHKGGFILGDQGDSNLSLFPLQLYSTNTTKSMGMILGNGSGRFGFNVAGGNGSFHPIATAGTGVIWKLGQNHNMILNMANSNSINPNLNTTNWNSPDVSSITLNDQANHHSLKVYNTGKITMGTPKYDNDSNYRLYVKDGIKTERIKVEIASNNGWADYVFKKDYHLLPLNELEMFIQKNKHLPEIPSEKDAIKNGIELKEMNILLLKKIEELTLHTIQQQKLIDQMQKDIEKINK